MQGILAHQSAEQIVKEMDATQLTDRPKGKAASPTCRWASKITLCFASVA